MGILLARNKRVQCYTWPLSTVQDTKGFMKHAYRNFEKTVQKICKRCCSSIVIEKSSAYMQPSQTGLKHNSAFS